jgi:hypothetical protein
MRPLTAPPKSWKLRSVALFVLAKRPTALAVLPLRLIVRPVML